MKSTNNEIYHILYFPKITKTKYKEKREQFMKALFQIWHVAATFLVNMQGQNISIDSFLRLAKWTLSKN